MLNNAWPSIIWHLYDYYMRPGGGYFGTKKACEPIHVQYSYDDRSIALVNDTQQAARGITVSATVLDFALKTRFSREATIDLPADAVARPITLPSIPDLTTTYFVRLSARDRAGKMLSTNFYWLSTKPSVLDTAKTQWYYTPVSRHADLTMLATLPKTTLRATLRPRAGGGATVHVENTGQALAFQVRLAIVNASTGAEYLPVFWDDNYIALLPGESRDIAVDYAADGTAPAALRLDGWNVPSMTVPSGGR
jgi:exo-1,4-beta-D-glucosaminidase